MRHFRLDRFDPRTVDRGMLISALSYALCATTFVLVLLGGLVHTQGASLACPDWPLCYGMVMPPMQGDIALEHGHRLLASAVGVMTIAQSVAIWRAGGRVRATLLRPALLGIVLVLCQGGLGGLTVLLRLPPVVSVAHWSLSMVFFAWTVSMALWLRQASGAPAINEPLPGRRLVWLAAITVWLQGIVGSAVRHTHASLACGQQWLGCGDGVVPQNGPQWLQTSHRLLAIVVLLLVGGGTVPALRAARQRGVRMVRGLGRAAHTLLALQIVFGVLTLTSGIHVHVVMSHVACGALLWAVLVAMAVSMAPATMAPLPGISPRSRPAWEKARESLA